MTRYGYARVSTKEQQASLDAQVERLRDGEECVHVYRDVISGSLASRPGLDEAKSNLRAGDELVVTKLDRLGRTTLDTLRTIEELDERDITIKALDLDLDTSSPAGRLVVSVMASLAQFERDRLIERTNEGIAHARKQGKRFGRPPALDANATASVVASLDSGMTVTAVAKLHGVSRLTIRRAYENATGRRPIDRQGPTIDSPSS